MNELKYALKDDLESLLAEYQRSVPKQDETQEEVEYHREYYPDSYSDTLSQFHVFVNSPPIHTDGAVDDSDFPYVAIHCEDGNRESAVERQQMTVQLFIGIYNDAKDFSGMDDRDSVVQKIIDHYDAQPIVGGKFRAVYPQNWTVPDNDDGYYPYFYAGVQITFERVSMEYQDEFL